MLSRTVLSVVVAVFTLVSLWAAGSALLDLIRSAIIGPLRAVHF